MGCPENTDGASPDSIYVLYTHIIKQGICILTVHGMLEANILALGGVGGAP